MLIANGANVDAITGSGWTTLIWAAFFGHTDVVEYLIYAGNKKIYMKITLQSVV